MSSDPVDVGVSDWTPPLPSDRDPAPGLPEEPRSPSPLTDGLSKARRSELLRLCEWMVAPAAYEAFGSDLKGHLSPAGGLQQMDSRFIAVLHLNALRRAYTSSVAGEYSSIPLVDNVGNPADWLRTLLAAQAQVLKLDERQYAALLLDGIQGWFNASLDQGLGLEAKLAERFFAVYSVIGSDRRLPPLYDSIKFDPDRCSVGGETDLRVLIPQALRRYSHQPGPFNGAFNEPVDVKFDDDFDIIEWYVRRFNRPASSATAEQLQRLVDEMARSSLLVAGWDRYPPGVPGPTDAERGVMRAHAESWMDRLPASVSEDDFVMCWLELNRRDAFRALLQTRNGSPDELAIAVRDNHSSKAFNGLDEVLCFIADVRPDVYRILAPFVVAYMADLLARQDRWFAINCEGNYWTALRERTEIIENDYAPPSRLGREPACYWEGRQYIWRPRMIFENGGTPGLAAEETAREATRRNWAEICRLRELELASVECRSSPASAR